MTAINGWERKTWRNAKDAQLVRQGEPTTRGRKPSSTIPWYILYRAERGEDSIAYGYATEAMDSYALALNGHIVETFSTRKAVREAASSLAAKLAAKTLNEDTDRVEVFKYVVAHGVDGKKANSWGKSKLLKVAEKLPKSKVYELQEEEQDEE